MKVGYLLISLQLIAKDWISFYPRNKLCYNYGFNVNNSIVYDRFNTPAGFQCPICLKDVEQDDVYLELACKHKFHEECIVPWLQKVSLFFWVGI